MGLVSDGPATLGAAWGRASERLRAAAINRHDDPFRGSPADPTVLDLNAATPACGTPISGVRATPDRHGPPPAAGLPALRAAIAETTDADTAAGVLVTPGATGAFLAALDAFIDPGRPVVLLAPCSPLFATAARSRRARVRWVPTHVEGGQLRLDLDTLSRAMRGAALLAMADPGNPVGVPLADADAEHLRWAAERSDVLLYVDESYRRFRAAGRRLAGLAPARTLAAGSLAATGHGSLRVGWLTGPPPLVQACELAQSPAAGPVSAVCQQLAWRMLMSDPAGGEVEAVRAAGRDTAGRLRAMGFTVAEPTDGYFLWVDVGRDGRSFAEELLSAEGVRVGPGDLYGPGGERFVRLSVATDPGRLHEGLGRIARFVGAPTRPPPAARPTPARRPAFSRG